MWVIIWHKLHRLSSRPQSRTFLGPQCKDIGFLGSREDILAMELFEGFPRVKDYTSLRILVASHARLYP